MDGKLTIPSYKGQKEGVQLKETIKRHHSGIIPIPFNDRTLRKLGIERNFISIIKGIYEKPTTNIIVNDERLKAFP